MAWFKFGKRDDAARGDNARSDSSRSGNPRSAKARTQQASTDSVEAMRQKAKFRLIGSIVLVLAAVVGFPMLFDSQPRPVSVDIPIDIPDKAKVAPLPALPSLRSPSNAPSAPAPAATVEDKASLSNKEEIVSSGQTTDKPAAVAKPAAAAPDTVATGGIDDAAAKAAAKAKQAEAD